MYKQLTKLTMSRLPAGALTMTFVIYIIVQTLQSTEILNLKIRQKRHQKQVNLAKLRKFSVAPLTAQTAQTLRIITPFD